MAAGGACRGIMALARWRQRNPEEKSVLVEESDSMSAALVSIENHSA